MTQIDEKALLAATKAIADLEDSIPDTLMREHGRACILAYEAAKLRAEAGVLENQAAKGEQRTICDACGNGNLAAHKAVWTDDGSSFCPLCAPASATPTPSPEAEAVRGPEMRKAAEFLLWSYDRKRSLPDAHEAWEALRSALAASPATVDAERADLLNSNACLANDLVLTGLARDSAYAERDALRAAIDRFPEINPNNYSHDDVCALNDWGVEITKLGGDTTRAPSPVRVPEGWRLVPIEPTREMSAAFHSTANCVLDAAGFAVPIWTRQYAAMLAAVSQPNAKADNSGAVPEALATLTGDAQAAPSDDARDAVQVQPLEWLHLDDGTAWAKTPLGLSYHTTASSWSTRNGDPHHTEGIEAAKSGAQADYENRVLSALKRTPAKPEDK